MTAIILAGGLGTRLRSVVNNLPKCMAPINKIPFLSFILKKLSLSGVKKVILAVGYLKEIIIKTYGSKFDKMEILYSIEQEPLGTGGAILKAIKLIQDDYFFVFNGDTYFDIDLELMFRRNSKFVLASKKMDDISRYGNLIIENDYIKAFEEKGKLGSGFINGGIYYISRDILNKYSFPINFSFEKDFLEKEYKNLNFKAIIFDNLFIDIGIPADFELAQSLLKYE